MAFEELNDREQEILKFLIEHYISTAEPVGSRVLSQKYGLGLSPATVRNTMQDLEEHGLVKQPHTSAGRIPTDEGYRTYVDHLLQRVPLPWSDARALEKQLSGEGLKVVDDLLEKTTRVLASISRQLGVTLAPRFNEGILYRVELIPVASKKVLLILTVKSGLARTLLLEMDIALREDVISRTSQLLNERLSGWKIGDLYKDIEERVKDLEGADARLIRMFVDASDSLLLGAEPNALRTEGTSNLLINPEFQDYQKLTQVIQMIEERSSLVDLLQKNDIGEGIVITIGKEIKLSAAEPCAMVTAPYTAGRVSGTIGIIGPKRMNYGWLSSLVEATANLLTKQLRKIF